MAKSTKSTMARVAELESKVAELTAENANLVALLRYVESSKPTVIKSGNLKFDRKKQVRELLESKPHSIAEIADKLNISNKNVSSQICYLKKEGLKIATNSDGQKFLE